MQAQDNPVDRAIIIATNEQLQEPDQKLMKDVADLINSRSDIPKLAITSIGKRLMLLRNTKVQLLTLELIEYCTYLCETTFYTQISTSDFLQRFNTVLNPSMNQQVQQRSLQILAVLKSLMGSNPDLFPTFFQFLGKVQQKYQLPTNYESRYSQLRKQQVFSKPGNSITSISGSENPKTAKLKKDLEIVKSNILLTNEIVDNSNPQEDATKNDILTDMVKTLKGVEDKLRSLITNMTGNDEVMMSYCLELNDDLMRTFDRYETLKKHRKPNPFKMEQFAFSNQAGQQPTQQVVTQQRVQDSKDVDWTKFQQLQTGSTNLQPQQSMSQNIQQQKPEQIQHKQIDLLDLFEDTESQQAQIQQNKPQNQSQQIELLSIDLSPSLSQPQQVQQQISNPQLLNQGSFVQQQQQLNQPQEISNLQSLYNQQPTIQQPLQQQQQPVNKYAVFNQQTGGLALQGQAQMYPGQQQMNFQQQQSMQQQQQLQQQQLQLQQQQQQQQQQQRGQSMVQNQQVQVSQSLQSQVGQFQAQPQVQFNQFGAQQNIQQQQQPQIFNNQSSIQQVQGQTSQQPQQFQNNYQQPLSYNQQGTLSIQYQIQVPAVNSNTKKPFDDLDDLFGITTNKKPPSQSQQGQSSGNSDLI